jgi:predicted dehydrogenase
MGPPAGLTASGGSYRGSPSEDAAAIQLRYANGSIASLVVGGIGAPPFSNYPRLELWATEGQARLEGHRHIWTDLSWARRDEQALHCLRTDPESLGSTRYTGALSHFVACLDDGSEPAAGLEDGLLTVRLAEAVYESIRTGRPVDF